MNSKESLDNLYDDASCDFCEECTYDNVNKICKHTEWYNTIKKDLDRLEKLEEEIYELIEENYNLKTSIKLLIYKCVNVLHIRISKNVDEYNKLNSEWYKLPQKKYEYYDLTPDEFDLLKEYLK